MAAIERILVPYDFSDAAEASLGFALDLARKLSARVTLLHVYELPMYVFPEGVVAPADLASEIRGAAERGLADVAERVSGKGTEVDAVLRQGGPGITWSEIDAAARELKSDLVVMGTHGHRGVSWALVGGISEKVLRTAPCPVLMVPQKAA